MSLILLCLFFLIVSFPYAHGLELFFNRIFKWHWAAVVGIAIVVSTTAWFVWRPLLGDDWVYAWSSLVFVFTSALPGMAYHGERLLKKTLETEVALKKCRQTVRDLDYQNMILTRERNSLKSELIMTKAEQGIFDL